MRQVYKSIAMFLKAFKLVLFFLYFSFFGKAQECTLDMGGENREILIAVFQLSDLQIAQITVLSSELALTNRVLEDDIKILFASHPQGTPEELTVLAEKYKRLKDLMVKASLEADTKLLSFFNERQYKRYLQLCNEAGRIPIQMIPKRVKNSPADPE